MQLLKEFREFAMRGNVMDLAIGVVIGTAFGKIVSSLVGDIITPLLGVITGGVDFKKLAIELPGFTEAPLLLTYGAFLQALFDFLVIALALFFVLKGMNTLKRRFEKEKAKQPPAEKPYQERLLEEIRDLLKK